MEKNNLPPIPEQGVLDYLTRVDELILQNTRAIRDLEKVTNIILPGASRRSLADMKRRLESGEEVPYQVKEFDMTSARDNEAFVVEGDHLTVQSSGSLDGVTVRFNMQDADPVPVKYFNPWRQQFFVMYLTHTAQPGKTLYLAIGREASSEAQSFAMAAEMLNEVSAALDTSTANLGIGATYTGPAFSTDQYGRIIGSCFADEAGTLHIDQRNDGINWDVRSTIVYPASALTGFSVEVVANQARAVFVNGAVAQTVFRLITKLRRI